MATIKDGEDTNNAIRAIFQTADTLRRRVAAVLEPHGITPQQYNVLRILRDAANAPVPTLEIAARLVEQAPGITRLLDRLDSKGLIRRERNAGDRRLVHCWLTAKGTALVAGVENEVIALEAAALNGFHPDEIDALVEMLEAIRIA